MSRILSPSEVSTLLEAATRTRHGARDSASLSLLLDTGARRGEVLVALLVEDDSGRWFAAIGSGGQRRMVRLGQASLAAVLRGVSGDGQISQLPALTDRTIQEALRRIGRQAGLTGTVTCRDTRRTWVAAALASGMPIEVVARLADHHPRGVVRASAEEALAWQLSETWMSPLDILLSRAGPSRRAA